MAMYKDTLILVDKVSAPLGKINNHFKKLEDRTKNIRDFGKRFKSAGATISGAVTKMTAAMTAMSAATLIAFNKVADVGDRIDKMSQKIGMSRKAFQEWDYIMSQNGGNVESLQMGFKTLTTQIEGVQKGSKDSKAAFAALGVTVQNTNGTFRSQEDIFNDTIRKLQQIKDPTKKAMLANRLFGRSAAELRPLLNQEADAIDGLRKQANDMGLIISDKDIDNAVKFKDTMDTFTRVFQAKFAGVVMETMPKFTEILNKILERRDIIFKLIGGIARLAEIIVNLVGWFVNLNKPIQTTLLIFGGFLAILPGLIAGIANLGTALLFLSANPIVLTIAGWTAAIAAITAGVIALVNAIAKLIDHMKFLNRMKMPSINTNFTDEELQKLSKIKSSMSGKEFTEKFGKETAQAVDKYNKTNNTTNNNTTNNNTTNHIKIFGGGGFSPMRQAANVPAV